MFRRSLILVLTISLLHAGSTPALAASQEAEDARRIAEVKAEVAKRGVGERARIKVKMQGKREVKGHIYQTGEDSFVVADSKTGTQTTLAYRDVRQVQGKGLPAAAKIGIGVGIGIGAIGILILAAAKSIESAFD